jgi:hypothetical protein
MAPRVVLLMSIAIVAPLPIGRAQVVEQAVLAAQDGTARSAFGSALAIEGDRIMVGAPDDDEQAVDAGAVYVFERRPHFGWVEVAKLTATHPASGAHFGRSLSLSGDRVLIGAGNFFVDPNPDLAYVFERSVAGAWEQVAELEPGDGAQGLGGNFAIDVALDGDRALIGAQEAYVTGGAGYVFDRAASGAWLQMAKLSPPTVVGIGLTGSSVALEGNVVLLGSPWDDDPAGCVHTGSVVVFERDPHGSWVETQEIHSSEDLCGGTLGDALALDGNRALVGCLGTTLSAPTRDRPTSSSGTPPASGIKPPSSSRPTPVNDLLRRGSAEQRLGASCVRPSTTSSHEPGKAYLFHRQPHGDWRSQRDRVERRHRVRKLRRGRGDVGEPGGDRCADRRRVERGYGDRLRLRVRTATDEDASAVEPESR